MFNIYIRKSTLCTVLEDMAFYFNFKIINIFKLVVLRSFNNNINILNYFQNKNNNLKYISNEVNKT